MVGLIPEPKKYRYFIAYETPDRVGRIEISRDKPITGEADLRGIEQYLEERKGVAPLVVTNWRRFEEPE